VSENKLIKSRFNQNAVRFVAIDSGTNGALCECSLVDGKIKLYKLNGLQPNELLPVLDSVIADLATLDCVVIEEPPRFMGTFIPSARIAVLFESFGILVGYLMARGVKVVRVTPRVWQKRLNDVIGTRGEMKHADWKRTLTEYAKGKYEGTVGLTGQTSDSLLIAEWWTNEGVFTYEENTFKKNPIKKKPSKAKPSLKKETEAK
jgi:hypothetical protein